MAKTPRINGPYIEDVREHSAANEVRERMLDGLVSGYDPGGDPSPGPQSEFPMTYDRNGNLISQIVPTAFSDEVGGDYVLITYTYDAWNRLVAINYDETPRAEYDYNGLNWRIAKRAGTWQIMPEHGAISLPPDEPLDQERRMFYSATWQLLEEHIEDGRDGESAFDANRHMQYVWGTRYIDDIVVRRQDTNLNGTLDKTWYHITDTLFSTVAILDDSAHLVEHVSYDAYGNARHHRAGDLDGDGAVTQDDVDLAVITTPLPSYGVGDLNRDGVVDSSDHALINAGPALPAGRLSSTSGTDNIIGYAGYNAEVHASGLYTVRHRHYSPEPGRWLTRDPIGYVDGMGLYEYVGGTPTGYLDPAGQERCSEFTSFVGLSGCSPRPPASFGLFAQACVELGVNNQLRHCEYDCCNSDVRERWILQADAHFKGSIKVTGGFQVYIKVGRLTVDGWLGAQGQGFAEGGVGGMGLSWAIPCDGNARVTEQRYCFPFSMGVQIDVGGRLSVHSTWFSWTVGVTGWARAEVDFTLCIICSERCVPESIDFNSIRFSSGLQVCIGPGCVNLPGPSGSW